MRYGGLGSIDIFFSTDRHSSLSFDAEHEMLIFLFFWQVISMESSSRCIDFMWDPEHGESSGQALYDAPRVTLKVWSAVLNSLHPLVASLTRMFVLTPSCLEVVVFAETRPMLLSIPS